MIVIVEPVYDTTTLPVKVKLKPFGGVQKISVMSKCGQNPVPFHRNVFDPEALVWTIWSSSVLVKENVIVRSAVV